MASFMVIKVSLWVTRRHLVEKLNKKNKNNNVKPFMVKNHLWVFINTQIENPAFDSQVRHSGFIA
jgi:DNA gyrase/topoisomerase IV subunit B